MGTQASTRNREPVSIQAARLDLTELVNRVAYGDARIPITKNGKVVAVLVSVDDLQRLTDEAA